MTRIKRRSIQSALGHTLLEMLLSLVLLSIVMASVGSAVMFASQAVPDDTSAAGSLVADSALLSRIAEDLAAAQFVIEQTDHAVTVVVPDRTGDDVPDRVRYAWSGERGAPLFYQLNDEDAVALVEAMAVFDLSYTFSSGSQTLPAAIYLDGETAIDASDTDTSGGDVTIDALTWSGQKISPRLTSGALGFVPTRVDLMAGWRNPNDGRTLISIRDLADVTPGETTYASGIFEESVLGGASSWESVELSGGSAVSVDEPVALAATYESGTTVALELRRSNGGSGLLSTSDGGSTWVEVPDYSLAYRLYGKELLASRTAYVVGRQHLSVIDLSLQRVAEGRSPVKRLVRLMQSPPMMTGYGQTGFDVDPTTMDLDADGATDWSHDRGDFPASSMTDGLWVADGVLSFPDKSLLSAEVIRVDARMRSNDTLGPTIYGPYTFNERNELLPVVTQLRSDGKGGQELVVYNDVGMATRRLVLSGLPEGLIDVGLTLLPGEDLVSVEINRQPVASVQLDRVADPGTVEAAVSFGSSGGVAEFDSVRVRVGGATEAISADSSLIELNVDGIEINLF